MNNEMIHVEYAVPYWWAYGLFEIVPLGIGKAWDGCGREITFGDFEEEISLPIPTDENLEMFRGYVMKNMVSKSSREYDINAIEKKFRAVGEVISEFIGNLVR